jgi:signal transduction histidine kinase
MDILRHATTAGAIALALVAVMQIRHGGAARRWGAAAFSAFALVCIASMFDPSGLSGWAGKAQVCLLLAFPYCLMRFAASLHAVPARFVRPATLATVAILVATIGLPPVIAEGELREGWPALYGVVTVVFWSTLSLMTIGGLWREGSRQPTLARRRVRLMSAGTLGMTAFIVLAVLGLADGTALSGALILLIVSLAAFALGFAPPALARVLWRQREQQSLGQATETLVGATTVAEVTDTLLPHVAGIVGGSGAALRDENGDEVASVGTLGDAADSRAVVIPLSPPFGSLVVSTSPLTPFFGRDEIALLRSLAAIADISLARCALTERELATQGALRDAMNEAERANAAKSDFLSRMSHELRTPLNVVLGFGQLLEMRESMDATDAASVQQILKAGHHLLSLINEILDLSRIESGRMTISPEPVDVAELTAEALELIDPLARERDVKLVAELGCCDVHVTADRQRLKQVLLNLLANAVKYNRHGGDVRVWGWRTDDCRLRLRSRSPSP